jgi:hypothetical protein
MARPFENWTVLPHDALVRLDENLLSVSGDLPLPLGDFPRRMTVVRLRDGRLVVFSAMALDEPEMRAIEAFGNPTYLVVPSDIHRMDAKVWKDRYPNLVVIAPEGARPAVDEVVHVDMTRVDFGDDSVRYLVVPGTDGHEAALLVETPSGTTLIVNDLIWNVRDRPGLSGWMFQALRLTGPEPRIVNVVRRRKIKDERAVRDQLVAWSRLPTLNRIVVSHGSVIERDPPAVLRNLAESLAA